MFDKVSLSMNITVCDTTVMIKNQQIWNPLVHILHFMDIATIGKH